MFFKRKYTACLTDMPRQRISQTHKAINIENFPTHSWRFNIVGGFRNREVACSASDLQCSNFKSCIYRALWPTTLIISFQADLPIILIKKLAQYRNLADRM